MLLGFSMEFSLAARSSDLCPVNGNRLGPYYMGPKTYLSLLSISFKATLSSGTMSGEKLTLRAYPRCLARSALPGWSPKTGTASNGTPARTASNELS